MLREALVSGLESDRRRSSQHRAELACAPRLRVALSILVILTLGAITPLTYVMPADQTWMGGLYDSADYDDAILAVMDTDSALASGGPVFFPWTGMTQLRSLPRPASVTSYPRLTLADRAPPLQRSH